MRLVRLAFSLLVPLCLALAAHAQVVRWEASDSGLNNTVQLVFENCVPQGDVQLPNLPGVSFTKIQEATSTNMVQFQVTRSVIFMYLVRARQSGPVQIPAFTVSTDKGPLRVAPFTLGSPAASLESVATAKLMPERNTVWAGEVFGLAYELSAAARNNPQVNQNFDWTPAPLVAEDWSKPVVSEVVVGGDRRVLVSYKTRAVAKTPNTMKLEAASHLLHVQTGTVGFGFLSQPRMEPVSVTSDQPVLEVRPLPPSPAGFSGAVGQFKLLSKVVPEKAALGEPVTWTLELSGTGNWPDIAGLPSRDVSNDFQVVQPKAKRTPADGRLFNVTLTEDVVLVPTKAGSYTLGPVAFSYFDPKSGSYKTVSAPRTTVTIAPPAAPQFNVMPAPATTPAAEPTDVPEKTTPKAPPAVPAPPAGIPRDPLPGADEAPVPMSARALIANVVAPAVALAAFWLALAIRRAQQTDPVRPRREARGRLLRTLSALQNAHDDAERAALLLAWQHDTAVLWQIPHAAPPATALPDTNWATLWREADRALYGAKTALPSDWVARAQEAVAAKNVPGFRPLRLFLPRNLFPFAAALAVLCVLGMSSAALLHAAAAASSKSDPIAAYRAGDFATAEKAWRETLNAAPTDWHARHNLSLALAQQERPGEAAAQATAAFVQHPDHPAVRWHFALAAEKAGFAPSALAPFLRGGPLQELARHHSPAEWQRLLIAGAWLAALALGAMLFNAYGRRRGFVYALASVALAFGLATSASATAGVLAYDLAADARAVIVARAGTLRSIPTEAETAQKTTTLAAGSMAIAEQTFLEGRWVRLAFPNGQTGWVRREEIVALWK